MPEYLRLLHISDLHIRAVLPGPYGEDHKIHIPGARKALGVDPAKQFHQRLRNYLAKMTEDTWPKVVVVSGDLVDQGGRGATSDGLTDFQVAATFLKEICRILKIEDKRLLIVPGNHDVDWNSGPAEEDRFRDYLSSTADFSSPSFKNGQLTPEVIDLGNIVDGVPVEVALLVSPTFSGVPDPTQQEFSVRLREILARHSPQDQQNIERLLEEAQGHLDIALIGVHQLAVLDKLTTKSSNRIRLAVLHHHLLPHPHVEVAPFESVVDAGRVLERLLELGYDLVLTGHKHNRRLVTYRRGERNLDVYTAPSLFRGTQFSEPGFTIVDVFGPDHPRYARLTYVSTELFRPIPEPVELVREGRLLPKVAAVCADVAPEDQEAHLLPVLTALRDAFNWREHHPAPELLGDVYEQFLDDAKRLGSGCLMFRPPLLRDCWRRLIELASAQPHPELRLVSFNDVRYWDAAMLKDNPEARNYSDPLRQFQGQKTRILVLYEDYLTLEDLQEKVRRVIGVMQGDGFRVMVVNHSSLDTEVDRDFGIIADLCVSRFVGQGGTARELVEDFRPESMARARAHWRMLVEGNCWDSDTSGLDDLGP